jgi:hypothetical protein
MAHATYDIYGTHDSYATYGLHGTGDIHVTHDVYYMLGIYNMTVWHVWCVYMNVFYDMCYILTHAAFRTRDMCGVYDTCDVDCMHNFCDMHDNLDTPGSNDMYEICVMILIICMAFCYPYTQHT